MGDTFPLHSPSKSVRICKSQTLLLFWPEADRINCFNRHYAEFAGRERQGCMLDQGPDIPPIFQDAQHPKPPETPKPQSLKPEALKP